MKYVQGNLFSAPKGSLLIHSCNAQGVWGAGIASQFRLRFPFAYEDYKEYCKRPAEEILGTARVFEEGGYFIASLVVSNQYGKRKDSPKDILNRTDSACRQLMRMTWASNVKPEVHMPKINSGLFNVPWQKTESTIKPVLEMMAQLNVTVYEFGNK